MTQPAFRLSTVPAQLHVKMAAFAAGPILLVGCSAEQGPPTADRTLSYRDTHVHAVERPDPDGPIHLATHDGLWIQDADGDLSQVGPTIDLMGFDTLGPDHFVASGHPAPGTDLPEPLGLIESLDGGATWSQLSRAGESDFHVLAASAELTLGYDGALRHTRDRRTWREATAPASLIDLVVHPTSQVVVATTEGGVLVSTDLGSTWRIWETAPDLVMLDWADDETIVGLTRQGEVTTSTDAGKQWVVQRRLAAPVQAMSATARRTGAIEVLIATDTEVMVLTI